MASPATNGWRQLLRPTVSNRVLWLLCLMYLLLYVDRVNISTAAPLIKKELGFDNATLGLVFDALDVTNVAADAPVWEKVVVKLRAGLMPPAGLPDPARAGGGGSPGHRGSARPIFPLPDIRG